MSGLFKPSDPPTFGDIIWKLILRITFGLALICAIPVVAMIVFTIGVIILGLIRRLLGF